MSETDDRDPGIDETSVDVPEADAAEQRAALEEEGTREWFAQMPDLASEADVVDQHYEVPLDEDDYR
ncbi:MAG: hypothetical protein FWJ90_22185 [Actinomadura sp.]